MSRFTEKDLENLRNKGFKINDPKKPEDAKEGLPAKSKKIVKISVEKNTIELLLMQFKQTGLIKEYITEHRFDPVRRFRFDWALLDKKIAIEYEGIYSKVSRHTTQEGYNRDTEKYNLAVGHGWRVLRYTAKNYKDLESDLKKLLLDK